MYDVMVYDPERGGERTDLSTGSLRRVADRVTELNRSTRTTEAGVSVRVVGGP